MSIRKTFCTTLVAAASVVTIVLNASGAAPQRVCGGDPFIHLENGIYYLYFSSGDTVGLTVYTSTNLKDWLPDQGRDKFGRAYVNGNGFGSNRFWAPEMHKYKGKYYLFHSAEEKVTVDVGDSPLGPFRNPEKKPFFPEGNIDNSFFLDDDGTPYMLYAHFYAGNEVWICELEKDLLHAKPETQRKLIRAEEDWEMNRTDPRFSQWSIAEGPCLIKKDGIYWLTYSSHHVIDDNYNVCLATATNVKGPYVKQGKGPILAPKGKYQCTGHHSLFKDKSGNWKIVFHSRDPGGGPRYTYTADAKFTTKDGHPWIEIGEFQPCVIKKDARPANLPQPQNVPALMKTFDGKDVKTLADWEKVRAPELRELFEREEYGRRPAAANERGRVSFNTYRESEAFGGKAICKHVRVTYDGPNGKHSFPITAYIPKTGKPAPAFVYIAIDFYTKYDADGAVTTSEYWPVEQLIDRGYATAAFSVIRVAADKSDAGFSQGIFQAVQPESERGPDSWATISAWAWGASRVMDWMETEPLIDAKHVGAVGHSRGGKTALWTGVTDKRFAMACSNESGCGGAKLNHIAQPRSESIDAISGPKRFHYWFCRNFRKYAGKEMSMDFDQHELIALIAPRLVCVGSATEDRWAGPLGEWWSAKLASPAWELYGKKGLVADKWPDPETPQQAGCVSYHLRTGKHFLTPYDWGRYMDFADKHGWQR